MASKTKTQIYQRSCTDRRNYRYSLFVVVAAVQNRQLVSLECHDLTGCKAVFLFIRPPFFLLGSRKIFECPEGEHYFALDVRSRKCNPVSQFLKLQTRSTASRSFLDKGARSRALSPSAVADPEQGCAFLSTKIAAETSKSLSIPRCTLVACRTSHKRVTTATRSETLLTCQRTPRALPLDLAPPLTTVPQGE